MQSIFLFHNFIDLHTPRISLPSWFVVLNKTYSVFKITLIWFRLHHQKLHGTNIWHGREKDNVNNNRTGSWVIHKMDIVFQPCIFVNWNFFFIPWCILQFDFSTNFCACHCIIANLLRKSVFSLYILLCLVDLLKVFHLFLSRCRF